MRSQCVLLASGSGVLAAAAAARGAQPSLLGHQQQAVTRQLAQCCAASSPQQQQQQHQHQHQQQHNSSSCWGLLQRQQQQHVAGAWAAAALLQCRRRAFASKAGAASPAASSADSDGKLKQSAVLAERIKQRIESQKATSLALQYKREFSMLTLPQVEDPYQRRPALFDALAKAAPSPKAMALVAWGRMRVAAMEWILVRQLASRVPTFDRDTIASEVAQLYLDVCGANARMHPDLVRDLVSKELLHKLQARADRRRNRERWSHIEWELLDADRLKDNIELVQTRMIKMAKESPFEFYQLTFRISSQQRFAAYRVVQDAKQPGKARKELAHGDPTQVFDALEYWVIEHKAHKDMKTKLKGARWRLVGEVDVA